MSAVNSGQFVFVFDVFSVFKASVLAESDFEFLNFSVEVVDDVFVLADVEGD